MSKKRLKKRIHSSKENSQSTQAIVHQKRSSYVIECRSKGDGEAYMLAKRLEDLGLEVHSVLNKTGTIYGLCLDEVANNIKQDMMVKSIELDD